MKITVVTLYDDAQVEHFVCAYHGTISVERRRELAEGLNAIYPEEGEDEGDDAEDGRFLYFAEVESLDPIDDPFLVNIHGS